MNLFGPAHPPLLLLSCLLLLVGSAFAQDGFEVGLASYPTDGFTVAAHAALPLFEARDVVHAARADLSYAFEGLPGLSLSYLMSGTPPDSDIVRYLGAGLGVSFPEAPVASPLPSLHGLAGVRLPVTDRLHAFGEVSVAGNAVGSGLGVGLGLAFSFGSDR